MKKKIILVASVIGIATLSAFAFAKGMHGHHKHKDPDKMAKHMTEVMTEELSLTKDQQKKVTKLNEEFAQKMHELHNSEGNKMDKMPKAIEMMTEQRAKLAEILDNDQMAKLDVLTEKMHDHMMAMHMHHGAMEGAHKEMMEKILPIAEKERAIFDSQLTAEEKATIEEFRGKFNEMKHDHPHHRKGEFPSKEERKAMHEKMEAHKAEAQPLFDIAHKYESQLKEIFERVHQEAGFEKPDLPEHAQKHHDKMFKMMSVRFLMLDPTETATVEKTPVKIFPNPATEKATVEYSVKTTSTVKIELLDGNGVSIRTLLEKEQEPGDHTLSVDLTNEKEEGLYIISVVINETASTHKFMIHRP